MNDMLLHLYIAFMTVVAVGLWWGIRCLERRARIARGNRE
jgi:hypothetical protein